MTRRAAPPSADPDTLRGLAALVREDWQTHCPRPLAKPGFHAIALHRFGYWQRRLPPGPRLAARILHDALYFVVRVFYGIELPRTTRVGRRVEIAHQGGIVIGTQADIGDDCVIRQNVTIGGARRGSLEPTLGRGVEIGAGAVIFGGIVIGDDARIGPNTVISVDIPAGARVVAPPARIVVPTETARPFHPNGASRSTPSAADVLGLLREVVQLPGQAESDTPLLSSGLIDSLGLTIVLDAIELRYGVVIESDRLSAEEFDTAAQISSLVAELQSRQQER